jgi:hypothetical protein
VTCAGATVTARAAAMTAVATTVGTIAAAVAATAMIAAATIAEAMTAEAAATGRAPTTAGTTAAAIAHARQTAVHVRPTAGMNAAAIGPQVALAPVVAKSSCSRLCDVPLRPFSSDSKAVLRALNASWPVGQSEVCLIPRQN